MTFKEFFYGTLKATAQAIPLTGVSVAYAAANATLGSLFLKECGLEGPNPSKAAKMAASGTAIIAGATTLTYSLASNFGLLSPTNHPNNRVLAKLAGALLVVELMGASLGYFLFSHDERDYDLYLLDMVAGTALTALPLSCCVGLTLKTLDYCIKGCTEMLSRDLTLVGYESITDIQKNNLAYRMA